jgi:hypothetical protein
MARTDLLRSHAEDCIALARQTTNDEVRARWIQMAQWWLQKAEDLERAVVEDSGRGIKNNV